MVRPMTASPTEITVRVVGLGTKSVSAVVAIWQLITHCMNPEAPPRFMSDYWTMTQPFWAWWGGH